MTDSVKFILKSGAEFTIKCDNCKITKYAGNITGYEIEGLNTKTTNLFPLYIDISQIAAVLQICEDNNNNVDI